MTLNNVHASYDTVSKKLTVTGNAPISSTVRVLVSPTLGSYTTADQIYEHYEQIAAVAKKQGSGMGNLKFTIEFASILTVPNKVVVVTSDDKEVDPFVSIIVVT